MTTTEDTAQDGTGVPQFRTRDDDDLVELLQRAEVFAREGAHAPVMAAEFREAREYVENEVL